MIVLVAAIAQNNALGKDNSLIWHLPNDLKRFKALTLNGHILMGRKTFESLPGILPKRTHIVITRNPDFKPDGALVAQSLQEALALVPKGENAYIIGGGQIYAQALPMADLLELTLVHHSFDADTFFPDLDPNQWVLTYQEEHDVDEKHPYPYTFQRYIKRK